MAGMDAAEEDASIALLAIDFHEVGIFKGGGLDQVDAVGASLECGTGTVVYIVTVMGDGVDG